MKIYKRVREADQCEAHGFAKFNGNKHLCIDIPEGNFTLSTRDCKGRKVTFAFVSYDEDGIAPGCIDIQQHGVESQRPIIFYKGGADPYHWKRDASDESSPQITTLVLQ